MQASTRRRKRKRSGKRFAHPAGRRMQSQACLVAGTVCGCSLDPHPRGWVRRAGNTPPCAASFFPYSFFAGEERIWPPEGASPLAWKKLRRSGYHPSKKAIKSPPQCVSNSEAASGLLTSSQGTDAPTNLSGTPYSVRLQPRRRMQGWVLRAGGPPPALSGVFLPRFFLRWRIKNRAPGGR